MSILNLLPFIVVGTSFTVLGAFKLYGAIHGIEGGRDKPTFQYLCGT